AWSTNTAVQAPRADLAGCGTTLEALSFGGAGSTIVDTSEIWNGSIWSITSSLNFARTYLAGCGTVTDALSFGGGYGAITEKWTSISIPGEAATYYVSGWDLNVIIPDTFEQDIKNMLAAGMQLNVTYLDPK